MECFFRQRDNYKSKCVLQFLCDITIMAMVIITFKLFYILYCVHCTSEHYFKKLVLHHLNSYIIPTLSDPTIFIFYTT